MIKRISLLLFILFSSITLAAEKKKVNDKIYAVPVAKPQIEIGSANDDQSDIHEKHRPHDPLYVGILRSALSYDVNSLVANTSKFKPELVGLSIAKKTNNKIYFKGQFEIGGELQRFSRSAGSVEQKLNLFQINIIQNINLIWSFRNTLFYTAGVGISPVYLTAEKSVLGNSFSELGAMASFKLDMLYPVSARYEVDLGLKAGVGSVGGTSIFVSGISLGLNFD